jgi:hypothetical protein
MGATLLAVPKRWIAVGIGAERFALYIGILGLFLGLVGSSWDVAWHRALGRDTFWSTPHLLMYIGTSLVGASSLVAVATAMRGRHAMTAEMRLGRLHVERSLAIVGFGAFTIISAAPIDDLWHRMFGRDVDIWSPPHMVAIGGAILAYAGWAAAVSVGFGQPSRRMRDLLVIALLAGLAGTFVFGMNFYYIFAWSREAFGYPLVVCATIPAALAVGIVLVSSRYAATGVAVAYTALNLGAILVLRIFGWPAPALAPLVVAGAIVVDLVRAHTRSKLLMGLAFAAAFLVAEGLRLIVTQPLPSVAILTDRSVGHLATQYWEMATTRSWMGPWPFLALIAGIPLAALSFAAGRAGAVWLTRDRHAT